MFRSLSSPLGTVLLGSAAAVLAFTAVRFTAAPAGRAATARVRHVVTSPAEGSIRSAGPSGAPQAVAGGGVDIPTPTEPVRVAAFRIAGRRSPTIGPPLPGPTTGNESEPGRPGASPGPTDDREQGPE